MTRVEAIKYLRQMDTWKAFDKISDAAELVSALGVVGYDAALFVVDSTVMVWTNAPEHVLD